jgi:hypothetical protein
LTKWEYFVKLGKKEKSTLVYEVISVVEM